MVGAAPPVQSKLDCNGSADSCDSEEVAPTTKLLLHFPRQDEQDILTTTESVLVELHDFPSCLRSGLRSCEALKPCSRAPALLLHVVQDVKKHLVTGDFLRQSWYLTGLPPCPVPEKSTARHSSCPCSDVVCQSCSSCTELHAGAGSDVQRANRPGTSGGCCTELSPHAFMHGGTLTSRVSGP